MQDQETTFQRSLALFERLLTVVAGTTISAALLYVAGAAQSFTAESQSALLRVIEVGGSFTVVGALGALIGELLAVVLGQRRRRLLARLAALVVTLVVVLGLLLAGVGLLVMGEPQI